MRMKVCFRSGRRGDLVRAVRDAIAFAELSRKAPRLRGALHALEQVRVAAAHLELLRAALDAHQLAPALVAADAGNGAGVDQRGAVDLPELRRVEPGDELPDRRADQRFLLR